MSVAILIQRHSPEESKLVPVASEETFRTSWVNLAVALGLEWLPLFQSGQPVPIEMLPTVVSEFEEIELAFRRAARHDLADRAATAAQALRQESGHVHGVEVFIG